MQQRKLHVRLNENCSEQVPYRSPDYPIYINRALLSQYPNYAAPDHWHEDIEFLYIVSGQMEYSVNGEVLRLSAGEGLIVTSGQMHYGFSRSKTECGFLCMLLHPMLLCPVHAFERDYVTPVFYGGGTPYLRLCPGTDWHEQILSILYAFYENQNAPAAPLRLLSGFASICALLYENLPRDAARTPDANPNLAVMKDMISFIQQSYTQKITLSDIARAGAVGQSKCCKLFQQFFLSRPSRI